MTSVLCAPIALAREILPKSLLRARFNDLELVIWRDDKDAINVWEDRCPHRSVRLSAGRNHGDGVQCIYHGWKFGCTGNVCDIPAKRGEALPEIRVSVISSKVIDGFLWASTEGEVKLPVGFHPSETDVFLRPLYVKACAAATQELLDRESGATLLASPGSEDCCTVFGYAEAEQGRSNLQTLHQWNNRLNVLRRTLEQGVMQ